MDGEIPATSYSTIFHCDQSFFVCFLRLCEGLISVGMFFLFWKGYKVINQQRNNKVSKQDRWLYNLAICQTVLLSLYYLIFEEFFMLATIRNFLIWISINVLHMFCILNWEDKNIQKYIQIAVYFLQGVNFVLWFMISLGDGSSLENTDFNLGYNCMVSDWMLMSGILLIINIFIAALGYLKIQKLDHQSKFLEINDKRKANLIEQERTSILLMICSGLIGSLIMFGWDFIAFTNSIDQKSCEHLFSGDSVFRNILCFLLKIISMQFNPSVIYYNVYFSRRQIFQANEEDQFINGEQDGFDPFGRGPSVCNLTVSSRRSHSHAGLVSGREEVSNYN